MLPASYFLNSPISGKQKLVAEVALISRLCFLIVIACVALSLACGGGSSSSTGNLRFLQASPDAPEVNLLVDGKVVASSLVYLNATGYISVNSGSRRVEVEAANNSSTIMDASVAVASSGDVTLLMTGPASGTHPLVLNDGGTTTTTGDANVRVVNASANLGTVDVYLVAAGTSLASAKPVAMNIAFDGDSGYQLTPAGAYEVFMTVHGTKNALLDTGPITVTAGQNQTVVGLDALPSGFTFAAFTDQ